MRDMFLETTLAMFVKPDAQERLKYFADHANSFEQWLNWEIMFAFQREHEWPEYSAHRELALTQGGYADIGIYQGEYDPEATALIETKIIWNNANRAKQIASAVGDQERIREHGSGVGCVLIVAIAAQKAAADSALYVGDARELLRDFERNAGRNSRTRALLLELKAPQGSGWFIQPHLVVAAYNVG